MNFLRENLRENLIIISVFLVAIEETDKNFIIY